MSLQAELLHTTVPSERIALSDTKGSAAAWRLLDAGSLLRLLFNPEDAGDMFLRNVCSLSAGYTTLYLRR
jgi:hypothetical protein